jgi:hypothetical protein
MSHAPRSGTCVKGIIPKNSCLPGNINVSSRAGSAARAGDGGSDAAISTKVRINPTRLSRKPAMFDVARAAYMPALVPSRNSEAAAELTQAKAFHCPLGPNAAW